VVQQEGLEEGKEKGSKEADRNVKEGKNVRPGNARDWIRSDIWVEQHTVFKLNSARGSGGEAMPVEPPRTRKIGDCSGVVRVAAKEVTTTVTIRSASWRGFKRSWQIDLHKKTPMGPKSASRTAGDEKQAIVGVVDGGVTGSVRRGLTSKTWTGTAAAATCVNDAFWHCRLSLALA
jgi:hypothetical protein